MPEFDPVWAINGPTREPTTGESDQGFPCGALDRDLFNYLFQNHEATMNALAERFALYLALADYKPLGDLGRYGPGNHTLTIPSGRSIIFIKAWGGGGGGGGANDSVAAAVGGAGGGYAEGYFGVTPGQTLDISVGVGGASGIANPSPGQNGGNGGITGVAIQGGATLVSASGGTGGGAGISGISTGATTPGAGSGGQVNYTGLGGRFGFITNSTPPGTRGGDGGAAFGNGARLGPEAFAGDDGVYPGVGGAGAAGGSFAGGAGGPGLVLIHY